MKVLISRTVLLAFATVGFLPSAFPDAPDVTTAAISPERIEADFLRQNEVRSLPAKPSYSNFRTRVATPYVVVPGPRESGKAAAASALRPVVYPISKVVQSGLKLAESIGRLDADASLIQAQVKVLDRVARQSEALPKDAPDAVKRQLYLDARWAVRKLALANPLVDFRDLVFVKRAPTKYACNCDQYLGWWSQPGGGLYVLKDFSRPVAQGNLSYIEPAAGERSRSRSFLRRRQGAFRLLPLLSGAERELEQARQIQDPRRRLLQAL